MREYAVMTRRSCLTRQPGTMENGSMTIHKHGNQMTPIHQLTEKVLTEIKAPLTKGQPISIKLSPYSQRPPNLQFQLFDDPKLAEIEQAALTFCRDVSDTPLQPYWLSFLGKTGNGKTHLAKRAYRWMKVNCRAPVAGLDTGTCVIDTEGRDKYPWEHYVFPCCYIDWRRLCGTLRSGDFSEINYLCDAWLVVLDDIGTEHDPSGFIASTLDRILNSRLRKWTLITCNLSLAQIAEGLDVRIASRMQRDNSKVIEIDCPDYSLR